VGSVVVKKITLQKIFLIFSCWQHEMQAQETHADAPAHNSCASFPII